MEHHWLVNALAPTEGSGGEGQSDEGVLGPPGKRTHTHYGRWRGLTTTAQVRNQEETQISHFQSRHFQETTKTMPLLILQPTTFGNFQRKRPSPPQGSRGSKIPVSSAPV